MLFEQQAETDMGDLQLQSTGLAQNSPLQSPGLVLENSPVYQGKASS